MTESNPYATPTSEVRNPAIQSGRPGWVWAIFILYIFSAVMTVASFGLLLSGKIPIPGGSQQYLDHLTFADYGTSLLTMCINMTAAVLLFRMRGLSLHFFVFALLISIVYSTWHAFTTGWMGSVGGSTAFGILFGYGFKVAVCFYVWKLKNSGILR